jgi:hypothetical protein
VIVTRPLTIGELFDRATTHLVRRLTPVIALSIALAIPQIVQRELLRNGDARHDSGVIVVWLLVVFLEAAPTLIGFAAFVRLFAADDDLTLVRAVHLVLEDDLWPLVRLALLALFATLIAIVVYLTGLSVVRYGVAVLVEAYAVLFAAVALPGIVFSQLAFATCVLDGTPATVSIRNTIERAFGTSASRWRTVLLLYAVLLAELVPTYIVDLGSSALVRLTHVRLTAEVGNALGAAIGTAISAALLTVAAIDYRVRADGLDLEASLDGTA